MPCFRGTLTELVIRRHAAHSRPFYAESSRYGIHVRRFPNMFIMVGPQGPGIIANVTATIGAQADHITDVIAKVVGARQRLGRPVNVEVSAAAVQQWDKRCASKIPGSVWSESPPPVPTAVPPTARRHRPPPPPPQIWSRPRAKQSCPCMGLTLFGACLCSSCTVRCSRQMQQLVQRNGQC